MVRGSIIVALLVLTSVAIGPGIVAGAEDPRFEAEVGSTVVTPGRAEQLSVTLLNDAEDADDTVERATNVNAEMKRGDTPFSITSGPRQLGTMVDGQPVSTSFALDVPQDIDAGTYSIPIDVTYEYDGDERETDTVHVTVTVKDRASFEVVDSEDSVAIGNDGTVTLTIENEGSEPAADATVRLQSKTSMVTFAESTSQTRFVGGWEVGERRTVTYSVTASPRAESEPYPVIATVKYDDTDGKRLASTPLSASVTPEPTTFEIESVDSSLQVGDKAKTTFNVTNTGDGAVSGVSLELLQTGSNLEPTQRVYPIGNLGAGETENASVSVRTAPAAEAGDREFTVRVTYDGPDGDRSQTDSMVRVVSVADRHSFDADVVENDLQVGNEGTATFDVTNTDDEVVSDVSLQLLETGSNLEPTQRVYPIGSLAPDETEQVAVSVRTSSAAEAGDREFTVRMNYDGTDGDRSHGETMVRVVSVADRQTFDVDVIENNLRVDRDGDVSVSITNTGPKPVRDANLRIADTGPTIHPEQTEYTIGTLGPGETQTASFSLDISDGATPTPRQFTLQMAYDDADGDRLTAIPQTVTADIAPEEPRFDLTVVEATVPAGESAAVTMRIENQGTETLDGINAKAFTDAPITITDDSAYVGELGPGESATLEFGVSAPGDAQTKRYPISMDFQYTDEDGDTELTDTYDRPVTVVEGEGLEEKLSALYGSLADYRNTLAGGAAGLGLAGFLAVVITLRNRRNDDD